MSGWVALAAAVVGLVMIGVATQRLDMGDVMMVVVSMTLLQPGIRWLVDHSRSQPCATVKTVTQLPDGRYLIETKCKP